MDAEVPPNTDHRVGTYSSVVDGWLDAQVSANTRRAYRLDLDAFGQWCAATGAIPLSADTSTVVAFQQARATAGDSDSTIRRRWSALSSFFEFAIDRQCATSNPTDGVVRPRVVTGDPSPTPRLSNEAVAAYRAAAATLDPRLDALVALIASAGLKVGEALALDVPDVTSGASRPSVVVRRRGESRRIVLDPSSARAIRRCVGKRRVGPVFVSERSSASREPKRLTRFGADHLLKKLRSNDEAEPVTANALRRFHISTLESNGVAIDEIRDRAGLSHVRSVRRYV